MIQRLHLIIRGRNMALTTLFHPGASAQWSASTPLRELPQTGLNRGGYRIGTPDGEATLFFDEAAGVWEWQK